MDGRVTSVNRRRLAAAIRYRSAHVQDCSRTVGGLEKKPSTSCLTMMAPSRSGRHTDQDPNLLVNGASGISAIRGMATNIPPHNLTEVVNGCTAVYRR
ncbi:hypothetical protein J4732_01670 [Serratia marcescens]|uniref:Topo IIA-type catalytic domain-containing protein n=1 Tax=Serratia marcescens TaxID=615 RepID=A0A939SQX4_SERMA|nr:hypothetical protein [Serratia marcescens]